ncbi:MAG: fibronectin type III domain-containing protein, partial [Thermoplasmata archaeon]|nr:fibronectin type III domain-containing protein [Thermoplasmata archaeon]
VSSHPYTTPSHPLNLRALAGESFVYLLWDPPLENGGENVTGYRVYRSTGVSTPTLIANTTETFYNDTDVENSITYHYYITALNKAGESRPSLTATATPLGLPSPPSSISISAGNSYIVISWVPPSYNGGGEITGYNIYRSEDNSSFIYYGHTSPTTTSFRDETVTNGLRYFYYITTLNIKGESHPSSIVSAIPAGPPSPPTNINISSGDNFVLLSWEEPEDNGGLPIKEYRIYRGVNSVILSLLTTLPPDANSFNDTEVENGITYYYYVTASNLRGESIHSKMVSAKPVGPPSPPENFTATSGDSFVLLTWDPPPYDGGEDIISYRIYRGESESNLSPLVELLPSVCSYNDTIVKNGKTYFYRITSLNSHYESQPSKTISATPEEVQPEEVRQEKEKNGEDHTLLFVATFISLLLLLVIMYLYFKKKGGVEPPPNPPTPGHNTFSSMSDRPLPGEAKKGQ